jgi:hypothetical protein
VKRISITLNVVLVAVLGAIALGVPGAHGAGVQLLNLPAVTFVGVVASAHNDGLAQPPDACPAPVPYQQGDEHFGDLNNAKGSFVNFVRLPQGATVSRLSVYGNDNDGDIDIHAYLIRKLIVDGTTPKETGYTVMASASSSGAVNGVIREFDDTTINRPVVDDTKFMYYAELVVCGAVEPFMVQVAYS